METVCRITGRITALQTVKGTNAKGDWSFVSARVLVGDRGFTDVAFFDRELSQVLAVGQDCDLLCSVRSAGGRVRVAFTSVW